MLEQQQSYRDQREREHHRVNLFATADHQIKANVRNEAPENSLGDGEGKGDEDYSQKRRESFLNFSEINLVNAAKHRRADEDQHRRGRVKRHHARERREKETRQKTKRGKDRSHSGATAAINAGDALDVSGT